MGSAVPSLVRAVRQRERNAHVQASLGRTRKSVAGWISTPQDHIVGLSYRITRRAGIILALLAGAAPLLGTRAALAIPPPQRGTKPEFGISAYLMGVPRYLTEAPILVRVWGAPQYDSLAVGTVRAELPPELAWVSGDTLRVVQISPYSRRPMSDRSWVMTIRPRQTGRCELRLTLQVQLGSGRGADQTDFVIALEIRTDSVRVIEPPHPTRFERMRDGKRFRFADGYLVPIETSEALLESEIAVKPRVLFPVPEPKPWSAASTPAGIPFVAMIGKDGRLLAAEFIEEPGGEPYDSHMIGTARLSLQDWKFAPAQAHGHSIADYLIVRVPVGPSD